MNSMSIGGYKGIICKYMLLSVNVMGPFEFVNGHGIARKEVFSLN